MPERGSCDQPAMHLRATGLRFFQNLSECGVNKIVDATMPVNPYDDDWVSLRWPNGHRTGIEKNGKAIVAEAL